MTPEYFLVLRVANKHTEFGRGLLVQRQIVCAGWEERIWRVYRTWTSQSGRCVVTKTLIIRGLICLYYCVVGCLHNSSVECHFEVGAVSRKQEYLHGAADEKRVDQRVPSGVLQLRSGSSGGDAVSGSSLQLHSCLRSAGGVPASDDNDQGDRDLPGCTAQAELRVWPVERI